MARKKAEKTEAEIPDTAPVEVTKEHIKMILSLIHSMNRIKLDQEALAEDIKAVAEKMNLKPGAVKEMAGWIQKEQEKGGVLDEKERKIELVRQVLSSFDSNQE